MHVLMSRLVNSPAYVRCLADLPSVCKRMERRVARLIELRSPSFVLNEPLPPVNEEMRYARQLALRASTQLVYEDVKPLPMKLDTIPAIMPSKQCYRPSSKGEALYLPCPCKVCRGVSGGAPWADENIVAPIVPLAESNVEHVKHWLHGYFMNPCHTNVGTRFAFNEVYVSSVLRHSPIGGVATKAMPKIEDVCLACVEERKAKREGRLEANVGGHTCYHDKGKRTKNGKGEYRPTGQATCDKLFLRGEKDEDGFSRTIALRYLQKRMVFSPKSKSKSVKTQDGSAILPTTNKASKTSSSKHQLAFFDAQDIEDVIQDAMSLHIMASLLIAGASSWTSSQAQSMATLHEKENVKELHAVQKLARNRKGNKAQDTFAACQSARQAQLRIQYAGKGSRIPYIDAKGKKTTIGILAGMRADRAANAERSLANRFYDDELEKLIAAVKVHGYESQKLLAAVLDISEGELSKRLGRLRTRLEADEARQVKRADETRLERYRDWEKAIASKQWKLARKLEV